MKLVKSYPRECERVREIIIKCGSLFPDGDELQFNASPEEFTSKKVTTKILQQIEVSTTN